MSNLKRQNYLLSGVFLYVLLAITWSFVPQYAEDEAPVFIEDSRAEIEGREDRQ